MSRSIKILEDELGFKLFNRSTSKLKLTARGHAFYNDIYPNYTVFLNWAPDTEKSDTINIGTYQLKAEHAGFLCDYFLDSGNCNIALKENFQDINQLDVILAPKKLKTVTVMWDYPPIAAQSCYNPDSPVICRTSADSDEKTSASRQSHHELLLPRHMLLYSVDFIRNQCNSCRHTPFILLIKISN